MRKRESLMDKIEIEGGIPLRGTVDISGAKNAALPLMCASLLSEHSIILQNVPRLGDIHSMIGVLEHLGVKSQWTSGASLKLSAPSITSFEAPYDLVRKMRASILVLGPLLGRYHQATVSLPGGCAIGTRPIDLHLYGLEKMGANIELKEGNIVAKAPLGGLVGCDMTLPIVTVTGTENLIMAAVLAKGTTVIRNIAQEPEIYDLCYLLQKMGVDIEIDLEKVVVRGTKTLTSAMHSVIPDRIEAGTYCIAPLMCEGSSVKINKIDASYLKSFLTVLEEAGAIISTGNDWIHITHPGKALKPVHVKTDPYPGIATDLQAQLMAMMCLSDGVSSIEETIWENRFMHVPELMRFGAAISVQGRLAHVHGKNHPYLKAAPVMATDLRASVCLVLAGLAAEGTSILSRVYHLDRGYENLEKKLSACGARIRRISATDVSSEKKAVFHSFS